MNNGERILLLRKMIRIRFFEETVARLKETGKLAGPVHTCIGQEAVAVGICAALAAEDNIIGNHRSHGYMIAKGAECRALMAEIFGKKTGTNGGKGGSMHVNDKTVGGLGSSAIVASGLPIACGAAFASQYLNLGKVCGVFFGDGSANEGVFYECMNLAATWKLPVLFILENNRVAVTTLLKQVSPTHELYQRAHAYGIHSESIDGQNVEAVHASAQAAVAAIRSGKGPVVLEANTLRFREHQEGPAYAAMKETGYRNNEEVEHWIANQDPVTLFSGRLMENGVVTADDIERIRAEERRSIEEAVEFAEESPLPDKSDAYIDVFAGRCS